MDDNAASAVPVPERGFARSMVDDFVAAAAEERARLEGVIAEANRREHHARSAIGAHEVMIGMLLDAQHELSTRRRDAEREAAAILDAADREAREIIDAAHPREAPAAAVTPSPSLYDEARDDVVLPSIPRTIDLPDAEAFEARASKVAPPVFAGSHAHGRNGQDAQTSEHYFEFLRGALVDDEPLGPRPE